jgi:O-antigen/teichoic acid export membrane protein
MQVRRSLWITLAVSNGQVVIYFFASLVMARLLKPDDIGAFSVAVVVMNMATIFRDLGCNPYLVRREHLTPDDVRGVLGLTLTTATVLAFAVWLVRQQVADFYHDQRIANVLQVLAVNFVLVPPSAVMAAVLARRLDAVSGAKVGLMATLAHLIVSISLAYNGYGPMAPALATTVSLLVTMWMNRLLVEREYTLRPSTYGWREVLTFSRGVLFNNTVNMATTSLPDLFIGRRLGTNDVGLYSRATGVTGLLQLAIGPALGFNTLPVLSQAYREGESAFRYVLMRSTALLTCLSWPFYVWLAVFAEPIIRLLYGPNWAATALLVPWLCLAAAAKTPFSMFGPALQAINQPMRGAWASLPTLLLRLMFLAMVPANSIVWVVAALSLADVLALAAWLGVVRRVLHVPLWEFTKSHLQSGLVTLVSLLAALMLRYADSWMNLHPLALVPLSLLVVAAVSSWTVFRINHPFADELRKAVHMIRSKIKSGQDSAA